MSEMRNKELYIFEKGVFWSGPGRKSRGFRSGQGRKKGAFARQIPVLSLYGSTPPTTPLRGVYIQYYTIFSLMNVVLIHS